MNPATHYESRTKVLDGVIWRLAVVDSLIIPGARTLEPRFFKDGAWHPGSLCTEAGEVNTAGPYGIPNALRSLYDRDRYPLEVALQRKDQPQEKLGFIAVMDAAEKAKRAAEMAAFHAKQDALNAILQAGYEAAQARREAEEAEAEALDAMSALRHATGEDLPLFAVS